MLVLVRSGGKEGILIFVEFANQVLQDSEALREAIEEAAIQPPAAEC